MSREPIAGAATGVGLIAFIDLRSILTAGVIVAVGIVIVAIYGRRTD